MANSVRWVIENQLALQRYEGEMSIETLE